MLSLSLFFILSPRKAPRLPPRLPVLRMDGPRRDNGHSHPPAVCPRPSAAPLSPPLGSRRRAAMPGLRAGPSWPSTLRFRRTVFSHFLTDGGKPPTSNPSRPHCACVGRRALQSATTEAGKGPGAQGDTDYLLAAWPWVGHGDPPGLNHVASVADSPVSSPQPVPRSRVLSSSLSAAVVTTRSPELRGGSLEPASPHVCPQVVARFRCHDDE